MLASAGAGWYGVSFRGKLGLIVRVYPGQSVPTGQTREHHSGENSLAAAMGGEILADYTPARLRIGGEVTHEQYRTIQELTDEGAQVDLGQFYEIGHDRTRGGAFAELEA